MIEVEGLTRFYGTFAALRDVSFEVRERAIIGVLGLNGAGKSTLLKILGGLLLPNGGTVRIAGIDVLEGSETLRQRIGFLPEDPPLYGEMRVRDFLHWCAEIRGMSGPKRSERVEEVMRICQLSHRAQDLIDTLSHGYRKRVGIAQAIVHQPELVILDEPISGLDPVQIVEMRQLVRRLKSECTVLISSHILGEISQTCDRILVIHQGRLVADGNEDLLTEKLKSKTRLRMWVRGDQVTLRTLLKAQAAVTSFNIEETLDSEVQTLTLALDGDQREALVATLVAEGMGIRGLQEMAGELEEVFLGLTAGQETAGSAERGRSSVEPSPSSSEQVEVRG